MDFLKKIMNSEEELSINITSMIDVIFILLIFFMVSTQFKKTSIQMELPQVEDTIEVTKADSTVFVAINNEQIEFEQKIVTLEELTSTISKMIKENPELTVSFSGDKNINYQRFLEVYVHLENAGVTRISIEHDSLEIR